MPLSTTDASYRLNCSLAYKGVKTRASTAANSLFTGQSTLTTIIDRDLPQPKSGLKIEPKKGIKPLKSMIPCPPLAVNTLDL